MTPDLLWARYSAIWSQSADERGTELPACVSDDVTYCDPHDMVAGRDALSDYMAGFQNLAPGCRFQIESVLSHHDRSIATWTLRSPGDEVVQQGVSFAEHRDGVFSTINGFFETSNT